MEYPKWLPSPGIVVQNEQEEKAVQDGSAIIDDVISASGTTWVIVGYKPKEAAPEPAPAAFWPEGAPQLTPRSEIRPEKANKKEK